MQHRLPQVKKGSAFLIISCTLLVLISFDLAFVPNSVWKNIFDGEVSGLATILNPAVNYSVGANPNSVFSADLNNDGRLDLAVANSSNNTVSVLLASTITPGAFDTKVDYTVGTSPRSVASADFNNDGRLDLAVANGSSNTVSVLLASTITPGTFNTKVDYPVGPFPGFIFAADFNNDGNQDFVTANMTYSDVSVLLGDGNGAFGAATFFATGNTPLSVVAADFNNDGRLDLATANQHAGNTISVLLASAITPGTFNPAMSYPVGVGPRSVASADFNNDGRLDLAVANNSDNTVSVLLGNGNGTFGPKTDFAAGSRPLSVSSVNFNNDGKLDLAVTNQDTNTVSVLLGDGNGAFGAATFFATGNTPVSIFAADFNNDGKQDLVTANYFSGDVSVLLSTPDVPMPLVGFNPAINFTVGGNPKSVISADFDNDGKLDLATANGAQNVSILLGNGTGFNPQPAISIGAQVQSIYSADIDNDGKMDLLAATMDQAIYIYRGNGNGGFTYWSQLGNPSTGSFPRTVYVYKSIFVSDFNNDGKQDISSVYSRCNVSPFGSPSCSYHVQVGINNGTFFSPLILNLAAGSNPFSIYSADLNNDGKKDLAVANYGTSNVSVFLGYGNGSFSPASNFMVNAYPTSITASDFDNNGMQDLAVANGTGVITVLMGNGTGSYPTATVISGVGTSLNSIFSSDFNNDGKMDLVTTNNSSNNALILLGNGLGGFATPVQASVGSSPTSVFAGDFNNDGMRDLAVSNFSSNNVSVILGARPNPVPTIISISPASEIVGTSAFTMTINGDGFMGSSAVQFNGSPRTTAFISSSTLTIAITSSDLAIASTSIIIVVNPIPGGGISNPQTFTVGYITPNITSINPVSQIVSGPSFNLTVNGTNFTSSSKVQFNGSEVPTTFNSPLQLIAAIPSSNLSAVGPFPITVFNPAPPVNVDTYNESNYSVNFNVHNRTWIGQSFTNINSNILESAQFYIGKIGSIGGSAYAQIYAHTGTYGVNGRPIGPVLATSDPFDVSTLTSSNQLKTFTFSGVNQIPLLANTKYFLVLKYTGGSALFDHITLGTDNTTSTASGNLAQTTDSGIIWNSFPDDVIFYIYGRSGVQSNSQTFIVNNPAPTITSISPTQVMVGNATTTLTITGTSFSDSPDSSVVRWDGSDKATTYVSSTTLTAVIPSTDMITDGIHNITVFNPTLLGGDISNTRTFNVIVNPVIPSIPSSSPNPVPEVFEIGPTVRYQGDPGFTLTVNGNNFIFDSVVRLNGASKPTKFISPTRLEAMITTADILNPGSYPVTVFNPAPGGGVSAN